MASIEIDQDILYVVGQYSTITHRWVITKEYATEAAAASYYSAQPTRSGAFEMWVQDVATGKVIRMIHRSAKIQRDIAAEKRADERRAQLGAQP